MGIQYNPLYGMGESYPDALRETNAGALKTKAAAALTTNAAFLALVTPTAAEVTAQVKVLTRESNALIRMLLGSLADISDT